jgi:hypothetical protein
MWLSEIGIDLPAGAEHRTGGSDPVDWTEQTSGESDLMVMVSEGRAFGKTAEDIRQLDRSVVAVMASNAPRWVTGDPSRRISGRIRQTRLPRL